MKHTALLKAPVLVRLIASSTASSTTSNIFALTLFSAIGNSNDFTLNNNNK